MGLEGGRVSHPENAHFLDSWVSLEIFATADMVDSSGQASNWPERTCGWPSLPSGHMVTLRRKTEVPSSCPVTLLEFEPLANLLPPCFAWPALEKCVFSLFLSLSSVCVVFSRIQERAKVDAERKELERLRALYSELKRQLDNCPESMREQLQDQMQRVSVSSPAPHHLPACSRGQRLAEGKRGRLAWVGGAQLSRAWCPGSSSWEDGFSGSSDHGWGPSSP